MMPEGTCVDLRRPKILMAAGQWGYGPIVTAEMIVRAVSAFADVHLFASEVAADYATQSPVLRSCPRRSLESLDTYYDLVVSVLEPASLIWAFRHRIRAVSIDNIYWHWRWSDNLAAQAWHALAAASPDVTATLAALQRLGNYAEYTTLYLAADQVIWQRVAPPVVSLPVAFQAKAVRVEPLLRQAKPTPKRPQLLVSLSGGLLNPVASENDWRIYMKVLAAVTVRGLTAAREAGWQIVVAAPEPLREMASEALAVPAQTFGHDAFLYKMTESCVIAAPKGLSTTIEAAAAGTALFTLPELHDGNAINYWGLCEATGFDAREFAEIFPAALHTTAAAHDLTIADLYAAYEDELVAGASGFIACGERSFATFVDACMAEPTRRIVAQRQLHALLRVAKGFRGLVQTIDILYTAASEAMASDLERGGRHDEGS